MALTAKERALSQEWHVKCSGLQDLIQSIKDALSTEEEGEALVEVARAAHRAELRGAAFFLRVEKADRGEIFDVGRHMLQKM